MSSFWFVTSQFYWIFMFFILFVAGLAVSSVLIAISGMIVTAIITRISDSETTSATESSRPDDCGLLFASAASGWFIAMAMMLIFGFLEVPLIIELTGKNWARDAQKLCFFFSMLAFVYASAASWLLRLSASTNCEQTIAQEAQ